MRVAVCDDEQVYLDLISEILKIEFKNQSIDCEIFSFKSCDDFLKNHKENNSDVAFLDIVMPEMNGFEAAKEIRKISEKTYVIFITTESSLVYDSFEFQPFYFVPKGTKDFIAERLSLIVTKLAHHFSADKKILLSLPYGKNIFIAPMQIQYLRSSANYTEYFLTDSTALKIRCKLDEAMEQLSPKFFVRIHKSYAVNMKYINILYDEDNGGSVCYGTLVNVEVA